MLSRSFPHKQPLVEHAWGLAGLGTLPTPAGQPLRPGPLGSSALGLHQTLSLAGELGRQVTYRVWTPAGGAPHAAATPVAVAGLATAAAPCGPGHSWRAPLFSEADPAPHSQRHRTIWGHGQRQQLAPRMCPLGGGPAAVLLGPSGVHAAQALEGCHGGCSHVECCDSHDAAGPEQEKA